MAADASRFQSSELQNRIQNMMEMVCETRGITVSYPRTFRFQSSELQNRTQSMMEMVCETHISVLKIAELHIQVEENGVRDQRNYRAISENFQIFTS